MTTTERAEKIREALKAFSTDGIRAGGTPGLQRVCDYQDLIMQADSSELREIEAEMDREQRRLFVWANGCTLSPDAFVDVFKETTARRKLMEIYERERGDIAAWEQKIVDREAACNRREYDAKMDVERARYKTDEAEKALKYNQGVTEQIREQNAELRRQVAEQEEWAAAAEKQLEDFAAVKRTIAAAMIDAG